MFRYDETLPDFCDTLTWGMTIGQMKEFVKEHKTEASYSDNTLYIANIELHNFPGDCGALVLSGANIATAESLAIAEDYASRSGFSVIFSTICKGDVWVQAEVFKAAGYMTVDSYASNRNPERTHVVVVRRIKKCIKKGY
jgi:hypothetical protein